MDSEEPYIKMHAQSHMSGQISGKAPNPAGSHLPGVSHPHGNSLPSHMQIGGLHGTYPMDSDFEIVREQMRGKLHQLLQRRFQQTPEMQARMNEIIRKVEESLFKAATSKEEYMNMATLEQRLGSVIRNMSSSANRNQQVPHSISSSSIGTMIPTPGMAHSGNLNVTNTSSVDHSMIAISGSSTGLPNTINSGNLFPTANGSTGGIHGVSFSVPDGSKSNGYQQSSANMSISSGSNLMPSYALQRPVSQMIPTPGLSNTQSVLDSESSKKNVFFSGVDSTISSKPQQPRQLAGGQNKNMLHNHGGQMGVGLRSSLQKPFSYGFTNGTPAGALGLIGNNMPTMNGPASSEGHPAVSTYGCSPTSPRPSSQHFDQRQHLMQTALSQHMIPLTGERYGLNSTDLSGLANYGNATSVGSQNAYPMNMQSKSKNFSPSMAMQPNLEVVQQTGHAKLQSVDQQSPKMNFQARHASSQLIQKLQQQDIQKQPHIFQQQYVQHQQKQQSQQHNNLLLNDECKQSQIAPNLDSQVIAGQGMECHGEAQHPKLPDQFQLPELQNPFQQNAAAEDCSGGDQMLWNPSGSGDFSSFSQNSKQMQQILNQQQSVELHNNFNCISAGAQPEALLQGQWHHQSQETVHILGQSSNEQQVQEEFRQRIEGQDQAQRPHLLEGSMTGQRDLPPDFLRQQKWLLLMLHARRCEAPDGKCQEVNCITVQTLWKHIRGCHRNQCSPRCLKTKNLLHHYRKCQDSDCPVCVPVRCYIESRQKACVRPPSSINSPNSNYESWKSIDAGDGTQFAVNSGTSIIEASQDLPSMVKRIKVENPPSLPVEKDESSPVLVPAFNQPHISLDAQSQACHPVDVPLTVKFELREVKRGSSVMSGRGTPSLGEIKKDASDDVSVVKSDVLPVISHYPAGLAKQESMEDEKETDQAKQEKEQETAALPVEAGTKSGKPKINGVSLTELFTPEQIRKHIAGLRQWVGQSKAKAEKNQAMEHSMSENSCQLCAVEKLTFEPPPIYCTSCGVRIKRNAMYYTMGSGDTQRYFCIPCYNEARGDAIEVDGITTLKAKLEKKKNDEETEEWWVQCDKCEAWQHQICALFNGRRNDGGQAEYTCPNCCIEEIERGERKPLPQSAVLGAKDLPRTILSDHIEQRLVKRLKQERQERARVFGKHFDEVPGAEALVVRVVSSVDKKLEVKQRFLEIFQEENYPVEFPYKSKVVLLFQKIEGVEVCLFGMYVQEFGSECQFPNQRRVYLSYLDSVKYFRPEIKAVTGEALRTFVYHEILGEFLYPEIWTELDGSTVESVSCLSGLVESSQTALIKAIQNGLVVLTYCFKDIQNIGYLEYCKKRGFTSCYIWACPPLKGEDYILYCHPEIQKTPKSDKLREWYLAMLRKAAKENIVVELTNLYDHFFVTTGECKAKVTAARLPYFDGDYWPGAAEDMINQLRQEDGRKQQKKGKTKKTITKRALKAAGHTDLSGNASKDVLLMRKLGETISPMKEDFIMVHLQYACTHCCHLMASGMRWVCKQCSNFQLCDKCHDAEQKLEERERHPIHSKEKHLLHPVEVNDVSEDTKDNDEILESEFFDTRQAFLSLCQGNHYQYDTLRRAKHSSMMVLYHLHNPTAPAFVTTCNVCYNDVEAGHGWRCEICPDYDVCNSCYQKDGGVDHPHKLTNHPSSADRDAQNKEARQLRVVQLRKMLDLLVHASQCRFLQCTYPNCRKVKGLFRHGIQCKTRASGGCVLCKKMWYILQLHARACKESECHVPRCKDLKEHLKRLQQQSDSRRRAAVMEMMRQRAAEVAGSSG